MNPDFLASCEGKIKYGTYNEAKLTLTPGLSVYKCRHGNHYHKGHK